MRKAKLALLAIPVLVLLGIILAFKARTISRQLSCYATQPVDGMCTAAFRAYITAGAADLMAFYSTEPIPAAPSMDPDAFCAEIPCAFGMASFKLDD